MQTTKAIVYDGMKSSPVTLSGDVGWDVLGENPSDETLDKLYSTVAWLYRCVSIRGNSVASMPFMVKRGEQVVYEFDGLTPQNEPPKEIAWIKSLPQQLGQVEIANILGGRAYLERRQSVTGTRSLQFDWLLPWSITPIYNGISNKHGLQTDPTRPLGDLLGFWRDFNQQGANRVIHFDADEIIHFWLPDYATEIGAAINYPGKAVLQNAGVVKSLDLFLWGYFKSGLIKATLLKYKDQISKEEADRVKEWFSRAMLGIKSAFTAHVVRGDFETMVIGDGVKDLRDNKLSADEKNDIAVGLGIPPSKLLPVGVNRATKDGDDRSYIEDTIIPEINWIYAVVNKQMLPDGYSIVANPQALRVMQADEVERSQAFNNYVNGGLSVEASIATLGIHVPDDIEVREPAKPMPMQLFAQQQPNEPIEKEEDEEIKSALYVLDILDARDEREQFKRWIANRGYKNINIDDFETQYLTRDDKVRIAIKAVHKSRKTPPTRQDKISDQYGVTLANFVNGAIDDELSKDEFVLGMSNLVSSELESVFRQAGGIDETETLNMTEREKFSELLTVELQSIYNFANDLYAGIEENKASFNQVQSRLQSLGSNLGGRLSIWKNGARKMFNQALVWARGERKLQWQLGQTEQHCSDCLELNGQIKTTDEWQKAGIQPQSPDLDCGGWNCDCNLVAV